ncbi:MAG: hypothetical protein IJE00_00050 [Clostridia bacterium]|nr:hypothetical protein [Clostridia bacterium]
MDKQSIAKLKRDLLKNEPYDPAKNAQAIFGPAKNVQAIFNPAHSTELHSAGDTSSPNIPLDKQMI